MRTICACWLALQEAKIPANGCIAAKKVTIRAKRGSAVRWPHAHINMSK